MTLSAGYCPVCSITGTLVFLVAHDTHRVFIACNMCEAAWKTPAPVEGWDKSIRDFAPQGFRQATLSEVADAGQDMGLVQRVSDDQFERLK